jgi:hypothetical protein
MVMDHTSTTHPLAQSTVRLSRTEEVATGRVKRAEFATSAATVGAAMSFVAPPPERPPSEALEEHRLSLLNVVGMVHCIGMGVANGEKDPIPEIALAFELLECEIQRIANALQRISLQAARPEIFTIARPGMRRRKWRHA